jgi:site-specific recombinase XerD
MMKSKRQIPFSAKSVKKSPKRNSKRSNQPPVKPKNQKQRTREYLSDQEINQLCKAAASIGRHPLRDHVIILIMFRHALRVSELISLRWDQFDLKKGFLHVRRIKNGLPSTHPIRGTELRSLRQLQRQYSNNPYVFISDNKAPLTARTVHHIIARAGRIAKIPFTIHPHMLRHSTGFYLANKGEDTRAIQSYLGHANIKNTVIYTELSPTRFKNFWHD